ncbi:hypothetical protein QN395_02080 [Undibacterium sp. RTI2.2]|uniref:hypothetical protein n=1 Tax=unclassified Undibacterium TaxID=2630295 RepID=UPI002AB4FF80|nr:MULTISPECIES: hypothetical protein [unclassified Undibacterium]MDY7536985.1 hypothetical protein [Undibacterium sp. 5I1]MEB0115262.1 hypothetical protein [Undibacterium sp. RTI2.2]MEB0231335.1 hypothetical protein [Undibacterium sp. 10I3]MEB0258748.1 hypothetical protein [Undibacterium sp. 5I1]
MLAINRFITKSDVNSGSLIGKVNLMALADIHAIAMGGAISSTSIMTASIPFWVDLTNNR